MIFIGTDFFNLTAELQNEVSYTNPEKRARQTYAATWFLLVSLKRRDTTFKTTLFCMVYHIIHTIFLIIMWWLKLQPILNNMGMVGPLINLAGSSSATVTSWNCTVPYSPDGKKTVIAACYHNMAATNALMASALYFFTWLGVLTNLLQIFNIIFETLPFRRRVLVEGLLKNTEYDPRSLRRLLDSLSIDNCFMLQYMCKKLSPTVVSLLFAHIVNLYDSTEPPTKKAKETGLIMEQMKP
ncbi:unnamed protein product [Bursaphelenchus xylophilus]|uniref:(pine wood nematode) hypothetical protein n=1 Tax=Bursaphelenchus xylophilus TaxID=6326 RepID=A0A1I7S0A9_BURXY|nr:unnamed protein product [Bursaphelenchus xylophilus]CAG9132171.1 unnamed protein product [Bursaphelenchus xylophilus]